VWALGQLADRARFESLASTMMASEADADVRDEWEAACPSS